MLRRFNWKDALNIASLLTVEETSIMQTAHQYAQTRLFPRIKEAYRSEVFDREIVREMGHLGLLGATIPNYGAGASSVAYGLIAREIERLTY